MLNTNHSNGRKRRATQDFNTNKYGRPVRSVGLASAAGLPSGPDPDRCRNDHPS